MNINPEQKRNINRGIRELGAANGVQAVPIAADELALMLIVRMDGSVESAGQAPHDMIPGLLRKVADGIELDISEGHAPTPSPGAGLL